MIIHDKNIILLHGEDEYLALQELHKVKKMLLEKGFNIRLINTEVYNTWYDIQSVLDSVSLFDNKTAFVVDAILDANKLLPYVEDFVKNIEKYLDSQNIILLFSNSLIPKTTKLYKAIEKHGQITEVKKLSEREIKEYIRKYLKNIDSEAIDTLLAVTNKDLFAIKNELNKLRLYIQSTDIKTISSDIIYKICFDQGDPFAVWKFGEVFLEYIISPSYKLFAEIISQLTKFESEDIPPMQIMYAIYNYIISAIKFLEFDKNNNVKNIISTYGYFFYKKFYPLRNKMNLNLLYFLNSILLECEYGIKLGKISEYMAIKYFLLMSVDLCQKQSQVSH
ncbi:MAG: hypothetical protein N3A71_04090 [Candidatus Dojkabacteria bacterium]|nr:hypothetical protein [Candidatus Dojkabacteria bacterium]